jgi:phosphoglycerate dehydrogenase-like enzyme
MNQSRPICGKEVTLSMRPNLTQDHPAGLPIVLSFVRPAEPLMRVLNAHAKVYTIDSPELNQILSKVAVVVCYSKLNRLKEMENLRMIQAATAGVDGLPWKDIPEQVMVCGNPGSNADAVAEHAWSLILGQAHNLHIHIPNLKDGVFDMSPGISILTGKTISIIGMGSVGRRICEIAKAFRMKVVAITKSGTSSCDCDFVGGPGAVDRVLRQSDVVVLSLPLTKSTKGMMDLRRLDMLKKNCIFVNMGRAELVNRSDLIKFLERNPGFRVATDVWWNPADYPKDAMLMKYANFFGTPYVAGGLGNPEVMQEMLKVAAMNVVRFLTGENPYNIIDRSDYL